MDPSLTALRMDTPCWRLGSRLLTSLTMRQYISVKPPICGTLLWQPQKKRIQGTTGESVVHLSAVSSRPALSTARRIRRVGETLSAFVGLICVLSRVQSSYGPGDLTYVSSPDLPFLLSHPGASACRQPPRLLSSSSLGLICFYLVCSFSAQ